MKRIACVAALAGLLVASGPARSEDERVEALKALQGTWKVVRAEREGKSLKDDLGYDTVVVEGLTTQVPYKGEVRKSRFEIDPTQNPKHITYFTPMGDEVRGIYEVKGNTWKELFSQADRGRPKSFKEVGLLFEYKRVKPK